MTFDDYTISIQWQIKKTAFNFFCFKSEQKNKKKTWLYFVIRYQEFFSFYVS